MCKDTLTHRSRLNIECAFQDEYTLRPAQITSMSPCNLGVSRGGCHCTGGGQDVWPPQGRVWFPLGIRCAVGERSGGGGVFLLYILVSVAVYSRAVVGALADSGAPALYRDP